MRDEEKKTVLRQMCGDLQGKALAQILDACRRYRQNGENRFMANSGQLLDLMKNPYADPPTARRGSDIWSHLGFGGGDCRCQRCATKTPREGFFKAPREDYERDEKTRQELDYWFESRMETSKLDEAEKHKRFLMVQELVRDHGWEWEAARLKVMRERTRELYPHFRIWPAEQLETP